METIKAKQILLTNKNTSWFGTNYTFNIYKGCSHGCIYCDSQSDVYKIKEFDKIKVKENALEILEKELKSKKNKGVVATGSMSDPYNPLEKDLLLTLDALKLVEKYNFGLSIATKSDLITRDIDIIKEISKKNPTIVKITITTFKDALAKKIEPYAPLSSKRFEALEKLSNKGIFFWYSFNASFAIC